MLTIESVFHLFRYLGSAGEKMVQESVLEGFLRRSVGLFSHLSLTSFAIMRRTSSLKYGSDTSAKFVAAGADCGRGVQTESGIQNRAISMPDSMCELALVRLHRTARDLRDYTQYGKFPALAEYVPDRHSVG